MTGESHNEVLSLLGLPVKQTKPVHCSHRSVKRVPDSDKVDV